MHRPVFGIPEHPTAGRAKRLPPGTFVSVRVLSAKKGQSKWQPLGYQVISSHDGALRVIELATSKTLRINQQCVLEIPASKPYDEVDPLPEREKTTGLPPMEAPPIVVDPNPHIPPPRTSLVPVQDTNEIVLSDTDDSLPDMSGINRGGNIVAEDLNFTLPVDDNECVVCYTSTNRRTPCNHILCLSCERQLADDRCPLCRTMIPDRQRIVPLMTTNPNQIPNYIYVDLWNVTDSSPPFNPFSVPDQPLHTSFELLPTRPGFVVCNLCRSEVRSDIYRMSRQRTRCPLP